MTSDVEQPPIPRPEGLPQGWTVRLPELADLEVLVRLRGADRLAWTGSASVDREAIESEVAGPASWTRRQLLAVDPEGTPRAWIIVHDRAARRTMVMLYVDRTIDEAGVLAGVLYAWAEQQAEEISVLREVSETRLDASPFAEDTVQQQWLTDAGYTEAACLAADDPSGHAGGGDLAAGTPRGRHDPPGREPRERPARSPATSSSSTRCSSRPSRTTSTPTARASPSSCSGCARTPVTAGTTGGSRSSRGTRASSLAAGAVVSTVLPENADGHEGSYIEYIGVHRQARGRGVAKSLLYTVIADAAQRGRDRVGLEVDSDSPTGADGLYYSMGWKTDYVLESWFKELDFGN